MTEQTKAVFENPQILREKLGKYLDTSNKKTIEKYALVAEKMFKNGNNKKLKMSFWGWDWSMFFLWITGIGLSFLGGMLSEISLPFACLLILTYAFLSPLFLFYRGCTKRAILYVIVLTLGCLLALVKSYPLFAMIVMDIFSVVFNFGQLPIWLSSSALILSLFALVFIIIVGVMYLCLPLYASQYVVLKFGQSLDKGFKQADGKKGKNVIIVIVIYLIIYAALYLLIDSYTNKAMKNFHTINALMNDKNYTEQRKSIQNNNVNLTNKNEQSATMIEQNTQIDHLLLANDDEFCESGRAWLSYKSLLEHNARIDENAKYFYEEVKSVDDVPANTIKNKGSVVICSFEGPDGMSVEYINKKVNKILSKGEWVEISEYEKAYKLDERVYKFTAVSKKEVQKASKDVINNMKLIMNDLMSFRSAGYHDGEFMPWGKFTTAELKTNDGKMATGVKITDSVYLAVGDTNDCIEVNFNPSVDEFTGTVSFLPNSNTSGICKEVLKDSNVKQYFKSFDIGAYGE